MSTYFTILSAIIRPEISEKISLGLLVVTPSNIFLKVSKTKISVTKDLLREHAHLAVKNEIQAIQEAVEAEIKSTSDSKEGKQADNLLFSDSRSIIKESYISYLSDYKYNMVSFSKPQKLSLDVDRDLFDKLYEKYVDENPSVGPGNRNSQS